MPTRGVCPQRTVGPLAGTYPTSQAASRWAGGWYPLWPLSSTVPLLAVLCTPNLNMAKHALFVYILISCEPKSAH